MSVPDYCQAIKQIADQLTDVGHPISEKQLVLQTLHGLPKSFSTVVNLISFQTPLPSFFQTRSLLQMEETRISEPDPQPQTILYTSTYPPSQPSYPYPSRGAGRGRGRSGRGFPMQFSGYQHYPRSLARLRCFPTSRQHSCRCSNLHRRGPTRLLTVTPFSAHILPGLLRLTAPTIWVLTVVQLLHNSRLHG